MIDWQQLFQQAAHVLPGVSSTREWAAGFGVWAPILLVAVQAATVVVVPVPAGPVTLADVALFGAWPGFAMGMAGTVAGSVAAFLLGRSYGRPLVRRLGGRKAASRRVGGSDGMWLLPVLTLPVPLGGDIACFVAGLSTMRLRRFALLATLGRIPGTTLGVLMASGLATGSLWWLVLGLVGFAALFTVARYHRPLRAWAYRRRGRTTPESPRASSRTPARSLP